MLNAARRLRRSATWLALAASPAIVTAGCAAPQFTYVANSASQTYFKVPYGWHKVSDSFLGNQLTVRGLTKATSSFWDIGYGADTGQSANETLSPHVSKPVALVLVAPLTKLASNAMSYNLLRDIILPVTAPSRNTAARSGFPLTGFRLLADVTIAPSKNVHGVRDVYSYTFPDGSTDVFDQVALTNSENTMVYLLLVHCLATCYSHNAGQIDTVMKSFTVGNP